MSVVGSVLWKFLLYGSLIIIVGIFCLLVISAGQALAYPLDLKCITMQGKSMEPILKDGAKYAFDKDFSFSEIKLGSIISFHDTNYQNPALIAHEVVAINQNYLVTRGIANNFNDEPISYWQIESVYAGKPCSPSI